MCVCVCVCVCVCSYYRYIIYIQGKEYIKQGIQAAWSTPIHHVK